MNWSVLFCIVCGLEVISVMQSFCTGRSEEGSLLPQVFGCVEFLRVTNCMKHDKTTSTFEVFCVFFFFLNVVLNELVIGANVA